MTKNDTQSKQVLFTQDEFNALAYAVKARLAAIEKRACLKHSGSKIRKYLDSDCEYKSLISLVNKFDTNEV